MTTVVNMRTHGQKGCTKIDRTTAFGNPFIIGKDGTREEVIAKYRDYFRNRLLKDPACRAAVEKLRDRILGCWCKPEACHGDIIKEWLDSTEASCVK